MSILEAISQPSQLRTLTRAELTTLCAELRTFLIENISKTGGHLASNLGVVELTVALHLVFDTSVDRLVFDVGHQSYTHKILTGRREQFSTLRQYGGLAGFPKPSESIHDAFVVGHASTSLSAALGFARAAAIKGETISSIAVIGDGALTGGMAYEAMADAGHSGLPIIIVLNDNEMSITRNVGGVARHLAKLRVGQQYFRLKRVYHKVMRYLPGGKRVDRFLTTIKTSIKEALFPSSLFESMGFAYLGPANGHDIHTLTRVFRYAHELQKPVLVHINTKKGKGYAPAEAKPELFHAIGRFEMSTGKSVAASEKTFSEVFGQTLLALGAKDSRITAVTAAMGDATGLTAFSKAYPNRFFDVGIAEQHAVTTAAAMAKQGLRPVCAVYSTFLQRSFDQLLHDVAIEQLPVVFAVDRAGLVGADGETHHGVFDVSYLNLVPGMQVLSPASYAELALAITWAFEQNTPVAVRYPRGSEQAYRDAHLECTVLHEGKDISLVTYGLTVNACMDAVAVLETHGISAQVIKFTKLTPLELLPVLPKLTKRVLVVEEAYLSGGFGERFLAGLWGSAVEKAAVLGIDNQFVTHGSVAQLQQELLLDCEGIVRKAIEVCQL